MWVRTCGAATAARPDLAAHDELGGDKAKRALGRCRSTSSLDGLPSQYQGTGTFQLAPGSTLGSHLPSSRLVSPGRGLSGARIVEWGEWNSLCRRLLPARHDRAAHGCSLSTSFHAVMVQLPFATAGIGDFACQVRFLVGLGSRWSHWLDGDESLN